MNLKMEISTFRRKEPAFAAIDELYKSFQSAHGRKTKVELYYSEYWKPDDRYPTERYVIAYHEEKDKAEAQWMKDFFKNRIT